MSSTYLSANDFPYVRYVNSKDGLYEKDTPSVSGNSMDFLLYGQKIEVYGKNDNTEIIDGKTDYWYRCRTPGIRRTFWIFGGYLSTTMPEDVPCVLGRWNTDRANKHYWTFNHTNVRTGRKETSSGFYGEWTLKDDKLVVDWWLIMAEKPVKSKILEITVTVIDHDTIILDFPYCDNIYESGGSKFDFTGDIFDLSNKREVLTRNYDFF